MPSSSGSFHSAISQPETLVGKPANNSTPSRHFLTDDHGTETPAAVQSILPPLTRHPPPTPSSDWGIDESSDPQAPPRVPDPPRFAISPDRPDLLTLRAFDESVEQPPAQNYVIGVYDPAAETDDWGDDFELDSSAELPSSGSRTADDPVSFANCMPDQDSTGARTTWQPVAPEQPPSPAIFVLSAEHGLPIRPVPPSAFATPTLTYASLLMFPTIGYDAGAVHPSCARVRELFSKHHFTIRTHFDALVRDCGGVVALDNRTRASYLLSRDSDLDKLTNAHKDISVDVLLWKLEWATLCGDNATRAVVLLGLSSMYKNDGNFTEATYLIRDALAALPKHKTSNLAMAAATELEYENCVLNRTAGAIAEAGRARKRATAHSSALAGVSEIPGDLEAPQQRGLWWMLRCKFLQADMAYELGDHDSAVQYYSEYIVESISRMIGVVPPPSSEQATLGSEFMRYCLFSPRYLVVALWTTVLSLGEMKSFAAAADVASLTGLVATAFGYDDVNKAASSVRARIKDIGDDLRIQYDDISKKIQQNEELDPDEIRNTSLSRDISGEPFDYSSRQFGDIDDSFVEDWDTQLEKEFNITIQRCDGDQTNVEGNAGLPAEGNQDLSGICKEATGTALLDQTSGDSKAKSTTRLRLEGPHMPRETSTTQWGTGSQQGNLIEAEVRQYLARVTGTTSAFATRQIYPKPTKPFDGRELGPREHENFLRGFVRSKDPVLSRRLRHGLSVTPQWHPSAICKLNFNIEPIEDSDAFDTGIQVLSREWAVRLLETVWKVVRSQVPMQTKEARVRRLILESFSKISPVTRNMPGHDATDGRDRLEMLAALLDILRLAREVVTSTGNEAVWFSRASMYLGMAAATVTPAAKAAVELFQAESRAHCGVKAVVPAVTLEKCANAARERGACEQKVETESSSSIGQIATKSLNAVPAALRQSVVDLMHALYWRTKAGFDESSDRNSLERLLHAEVASSLFLTGSRISPVDGSPIDLEKERTALHIQEKKTSKPDESDALVDETRRVSSLELVRELQSLWVSLPSSAGVVRAKLSYALAHHSRVAQRDYAKAERFLFEGLRSLDMTSSKDRLPNSFFSSMLQVSPISIASSPIAGALLRSYGTLTLSHSKYRYGIAALEAETDARRVRNMDKQEYKSSVVDVVETAATNNDWRRVLLLLHNLRLLSHPKHGLRNEFLQICTKLHAVCFDVGCFEASIVPLRAYSALIYEEKLRVLLQRYKRRLAKKSRSKFRRYNPGAAIPRLLPGKKAKKNTLASFFETPIVTAAVDTSSRHSATNIDMRPRETTTSSIAVNGRNTLRSNPLHLDSLLWPLPVASIRRHSQRFIDISRQASELRISEKDQGLRTSFVAPKSRTPKPKKGAQLNSSHHVENEFEEEHRELLRIEAEQEVIADSDRFFVEFLRAQTEFAQANYDEADSRCRNLLEVSTRNASRYKVWEMMARIRLKRREITQCLEFVDQMEREYILAQESKEISIHPRGSHDAQRLSIFRIHEVGPSPLGPDEKQAKTPPHVTFLRLRALIHGGRLEEALYLVDRALEVCEEHSFWDRGRLHYLRGKILFTMSSSSTASFQREDETKSSSTADVANLNLRVTEVTLAAFETASQYYEAAGDEICTAKSDLLWARTAIDFLFRRVVLPSDSGGGWILENACSLLEKRINLDEVLDTIYNVMSLAASASVPILLIDSMAALAEVKCIQNEPSSIWTQWVFEAWKLFSRLFTDAEDFTVVLTSLAPSSTLDRLRNLCGRLVRLVMCDTQNVTFADMNKHLRLFEAYVTLHLSIEKKMNLASSAHSRRNAFSSEIMHSENGEQADLEDHHDQPHSPSPSNARARVKNATSQATGFVKKNFSKTTRDKRKRKSQRDLASERGSDASAHDSPSTRPINAFLHVLGNEGVALGRQGFSWFINRPRQQVISAVKGTGAVLIPTNFFSTSKRTPGDKEEELGRDAEMIFPFKQSVGLGAMQILNDEQGEEDSVFKRNAFRFSRVLSDSSNHGNSAAASTAARPFGNSDRSALGLGADLSPTKEKDEQESKAKTRASKQVKSKNTGSRRGVEDSGTFETTPPRDGRVMSEWQQMLDRSDLVGLLAAVREETERGSVRTKGSSSLFGKRTSQRVWAHFHRIKLETRRYMHGEISMEQLRARNGEALLGWAHCIPLSRKEWTVPESIGRRLVYILYAHGVIGYYGVERGGSIERVAFGGKQDSSVSHNDTGHASSPKGGVKKDNLRSPTDAERMYLFELVKGFKRDSVWHKDRDSEIVTGLARHILRAPRLFLTLSSPAQKSRSRPIVLIADLPIQILPWELFFDHVVIRSHCLLDIIRGLQEDPSQHSSSRLASEDPAIAAARPVARFINFGPRRKVVDLERTEETRRQQLAFQGLLRLNHMNPTSLAAFLDLGGFSDPTAVNAVVRPTGPFSSPLSQTRNAVKLFGLRIAANIGKRNYPHMDFLKVAGLGSATTWDLKEAALVAPPGISDKDGPKTDLGAYIPVFMFSYADLVDSTESVFGLRRVVPNSILLFTPAIHMKVLARHLEDDELSEELGKASGRINNRVFPDTIASARALVEYVSRFSREKRIPIVVFLGQGMVDVFPRKRDAKRENNRKSPADRRPILGNPRTSTFPRQ